MFLCWYREMMDWPAAGATVLESAYARELRNLFGGEAWSLRFVGVLLILRGFAPIIFLINLLIERQLHEGLTEFLMPLVSLVGQLVATLILQIVPSRNIL